METDRVSQGQMIAAVSGVVLIISLFLKWAGLDIPGGGGPSASGWESQNSLDIYLFILALIAIVPAVMEMMGEGGELPYLTTESKVLTAVIGVVLILFAWLFKGDGISLKIGFWIALLATLGVTYGQFQAMNEEAR